MNVPMNDELKKQLISETTQMQEEAESSNAKIARIISASKSSHITISGLGFELKIHQSIPRPLRNEFVRVSEIIEKEDMSADEILQMELEIESKIVAEMCVDPDLKYPELWVEFDNQTGLLRNLTECIFKETMGTSKQVNHFRRVP